MSTGRPARRSRTRLVPELLQANPSLWILFEVGCADEDASWPPGASCRYVTPLASCWRAVMVRQLAPGSASDKVRPRGGRHRDPAAGIRPRSPNLIDRDRGDRPSAALDDGYELACSADGQACSPDRSRGTSGHAEDDCLLSREGLSRVSSHPPPIRPGDTEARWDAPLTERHHPHSLSLIRQSTYAAHLPTGPRGQSCTDCMITKVRRRG